MYKALKFFIILSVVIGSGICSDDDDTRKGPHSLLAHTESVGNTTKCVDKVVRAFGSLAGVYIRTFKAHHAALMQKYDDPPLYHNLAVFSMQRDKENLLEFLTVCSNYRPILRLLDEFKIAPESGTPICMTASASSTPETKVSLVSSGVAFSALVSLYCNMMQNFFVEIPSGAEQALSANSRDINRVLKLIDLPISDPVIFNNLVALRDFVSNMKLQIAANVRSLHYL